MASLNSARQKARDAKRLSDVKQLQLALEFYFDKNGGYPSAISETLLTEFIAAIPTDPVGGGNYSYAALNAGCTSYHIGATLEDGDHSALDSDFDAGPGIAGTGCPDGASSAADFAGTEPIYDLKP